MQLNPAMGVVMQRLLPAAYLHAVQVSSTARTASNLRGHGHAKLNFLPGNNGYYTTKKVGDNFGRVGNTLEFTGDEA